MKTVILFKNVGITINFSLDVGNLNILKFNVAFLTNPKELLIERYSVVLYDKTIESIQ